MVGRQKGRGVCDYIPHPKFGDEIEKLGVRRPANEEQVQMMLHGVRIADAVELKRLGHKRIDLETLITMRVFNLTPANVVHGSIWLSK